MLESITGRVRNLGLWPRMALGISLGFLIIFAAFSVLGESILRANTSRLLDERLGFAQMAARQLDSILDQSLNELEQAKNLADFDPKNPDLSDEAHILNHTFGLVGSYTSGIFYLDDQGRVILSHPPGLYQPGTSLADLPHVIQTLEGGSVVISEPFRAPTGGNPVTAINVPIIKEGIVVGILSGLFELDDVAIRAPLEEAARFAQTGHALLVDKRGRVIVSTDRLPFLSPGEHESFYREGIARGEPVVESVPLENNANEAETNHMHIMAIAPLRVAPWGVAVGGESEEVFEGVRRLRIGVALLGGVSIIGTWLVTLIGTRALVRPVQQLTRSAQQIASGDLSVGLQVSEGGEIGILANALDSMREQMMASIDALEKSKELLELRVSERTEALRHQQHLTRQLLRRSITAQEDERSRISRELHDETGQILTAIQINLDRLARSLPDKDSTITKQLTKIQVLTEQVVTGLRGIIADLRPGVLDRLGLVPALNWVAEHTLQPLGIQVNVETHGLNERLPGEIETVLYRISQEAISNVAKHSKAENLLIRLERTDGQVSLRLTDDGRGFNPLTVASSPEFERGLGLASMQERASQANGKVTVESAPRRGTSIHVQIPLSQQDRLDPVLDKGP